MGMDPRESVAPTASCDFANTRLAADALCEGEHRFRLLIESVSDHALYMLDPSGIVTSWNSGAERIKGYTGEEIIGQHFSVFYTAEDRTAGRPAEALRIARETGKFAQETRRVRKDGAIFTAEIAINAIRDVSGNLIGFAKITRDITQRKLVEETAAQHLRAQAIAEERRHGLELLRATSQTLAKIVEGSPLGIMTFDGDDVIGIWNAAVERISGLPAAEVVGRRWQDVSGEFPIIDPSDGPSIIDRVRRQGSVHNAETRRRRRDGSIVELRHSAALIHDDDITKPGSVVFITEDITSRKKIEAHLRQAQKMEAIGQLTGGIAHDFNNLLAIMHGNLELLSDACRANPMLKELADGALAAAKRGASLTHRLLAYSRQQALTPRIVDVTLMLTDLAAVLRRLLEESVELETMIPCGLPNVEIDPHQLESAIINLAVNARDAMPAGGRLTISAETAVIDEAFAAEHAEVVAGHYVMLAISDTGIGMTKEVIARALEPFYTTKAVGHGTGLGLSMVYGFVKQSEGHLLIYSKPGVGTTVKLYLRPVRQALNSRVAGGGDAGDGRATE
jgi:PAS domain S-box-containing protein